MPVNTENIDVIKLNCSFPQTEDTAYYHTIKNKRGRHFETHCGLQMTLQDNRCVKGRVEKYDDVEDWSTDFHLQFCTDCFRER